MFTKLKLQVSVALSSITGIIVLGTVIYKLFENWTWIEAFYFTVATITTVGYGDLYPTTEFTKLFTAIYLLTGVTVVLSCLGVIGGNFLERRTTRILNRTSTAEHNPSGKSQEKKL